jgi:hypothetical protein
LALTVGTAVTGFCYPGGIPKFFLISINNRLYHQDLGRFAVKTRPVRPNQRIAGRSINGYQLSVYDSVEAKMSGWRFTHYHMTLRVRERKGNAIDKI